MGKEVVKLNGIAYDVVTGEPVYGAADPVTSQAAGRTVNHTKAHHPQASRTLMRKAVKKPEVGLKRQLHVQGALSHTTGTSIPVKQSATRLDGQRLKKAKQIERSHAISRFHAMKEIPVTYAAVPVQQTPDERPGNTPPIPPAPTPTNKPQDIFEQAIERATNYVDLAEHRKHTIHNARLHGFSMAAGVCALVLIAAFSAYQNSPGLQLKIAGVRAGVSTNTPNLAATGFTYNGVGYDQSRLIIGLKDGDKAYQLSEQATNWSGQEMIDHISSIDETGQTNYSTVTTDGHTVYKFGTNQATWIKDGIWYQINGLQNLTDSQIKSLVHNT